MAQSDLPIEAQQYLLNVRSPWKMKLYFLKNLPSAWWWGLKITALEPSRAVVTIPYNWFTQNPFRSIYFAALAGAAELSTGVLGTLARTGRGSVSMLVVKQEMTFSKKAESGITFTCEDGIHVAQVVQEAVQTGEARIAKMTSVGRNSAGEEVARFAIEWSFKLRKKR